MLKSCSESVDTNPGFVFQNRPLFRTQRRSTLAETTSSRSLSSRLHDPSEEHLSDCFLSVALRCTGVMPPEIWTVTWF